jgi:hypothetical protein
MKLLTDELLAQLPALYAQEKEKDQMVYAKFFTPKRRSEIKEIQ